MTMVTDAQEVGGEESTVDMVTEQVVMEMGESGILGGEEVVVVSGDAGEEEVVMLDEGGVELGEFCFK